MRNDVDGMPYLQEVSEVEFNKMQVGRHFSASIKASTGINLSGKFTVLNEDMLSVARLGLDFGTRARLTSLLKTNTLVLATLSNLSGQAGGAVAEGFFLVDDQRNQYDLESVLDTGAGLITERISPSAERTGVLVFPRVASEADLLSLYYDPNGSTLGAFTKIP